VADARAPDLRPVVDRAEVNIVEHGLFASAQPHQSERRDTALHHALQAPAWAIEVAPPPAPPPPSESDLREQLELALTVQEDADAVLQAAEQAHQRAEEHRQTCQRLVADHFGLDSEIAAAVAGALRSGTDANAVRSVFAERLAEREVARVELAAAEAAVTTLRNERADASQKAGAAARAVDGLAARVLAFHAEAIAQQARESQAEVVRRRKALLGFDRMAVGYVIGLSPAVRAVIGETSNQDLIAADVQAWRRAADVLKADPDAVVTVALPEPVLPPLPQRFGGAGPVIDARTVYQHTPPADADAPPEEAGDAA
jgi:hypothetical protein